MSTKQSSSAHTDTLFQAATVHALLQQHTKNDIKTAARQWTKVQARRFFGTWLDQWSTLVQHDAAVLQRIAGILFEYLQQQPKPAILQGVVDVAVNLHDALLHEHDDATRNSILVVCETWWKHDFPAREQLIANALPLWLQAPEDAAAVQRLYHVRDAVRCIDFAADESLLQAILALASNLHVLKTGKKLLVHLMQNVELMEPLHCAIKVQMVGNKAKVLAVYGDVYYKAYTDTDDMIIKNALETIVWSDLVQAVLHAADPSTHKAVLTVLQPLHAAQKHHEELLHRLYGPILWRALSATQAPVRLQAAQVLPAVFPLRGSEAHNASVAMEKCLTALTDLLADRVPKIRVAGSLATAQILYDYWTILPSADIRKLLNWLVAKHASDTSSALVRTGALNAVSLVLQNPQSHAVLRPLLPSLGNLLHDKTESVRLATVRMLLRVNETTDIAFYHVVPVFHLNARLAIEATNSSVAAALTALLLASYFPSDPATQIARTLHFLQTDPPAAMVFYSNVYRYLDTAQVAALAAMLWQTVLTAVETEKKNNQSNNKKTDLSLKRHKRGNSQENENAEDDNENEEEDDEFFSSADTSLMGTLTETIHVLWTSIADDLEDDVHTFLVEHMEGWVETLQHFESKSDSHIVVRNILKTARRLPPSNKLTVNAEKPNVADYLAVYCHWGQSEDVVVNLAKSLESDLGDEEEILFSTPDAKSKKRKSRRSKHEVIELLPSTVALQIIHELLQDPDLRPYLLSPVLEKALEKGTQLAEKVLSRDRMSCALISETDIDFLLRVCEVYGRFALHQAFSKEENLVLTPQAMNLLRWTSLKVIPVLKEVDIHPSDDSMMPFNDPDLSTIAVEQSFADWPSSPTPTGPPRRRRDTKTTPGRVEISKPPSMNPEVTYALATSLVQAACVEFSEWLAVTGGVGGSQIDSQVCEWFPVVAHDPSMLAAMSKLALQLARTSDQYMLLDQILRNGQESNDIVEKLVSLMVSSSSVQSKQRQAKTVEMVFQAAQQMYRPRERENDEYYSSWGDLWKETNSAIAAAMNAVVSNRQSRAVMMSLITNENPDDPFHQQCLFLLQGEVNANQNQNVTSETVPVA